MIIDTCSDCRKRVRYKPIVGTMHVCLTACEVAGEHRGKPVTKRVGMPWRRRWKTWCPRCGDHLGEEDIDDDLH